MGQFRPLFVYFCSFLVTLSIQIEKRIDGVLGIRTRGRRMVGADKSTELWQPPNGVVPSLCLSLCVYMMDKMKRRCVPLARLDNCGKNRWSNELKDAGTWLLSIHLLPASQLTYLGLRLAFGLIFLILKMGQFRPLSLFFRLFHIIQFNKLMKA